MNYIRIAKTALIAGMLSILGTIAHAKEDWEIAIDTRVDSAASRANERCGQDNLCKMQVSNILLQRIMVNAGCVSVGITDATIKLKIANANISGNKVSDEDQKAADKASQEAQATCKRAKESVGQSAIDAIEKIGVADKK